MTLIIGFINQKGGVGKSTLARAVAVSAVKDGAKVLLADLDVEQQTCVVWRENRKRGEIQPDIDVRPFKTHTEAIETAKAEDVDVLVLDTRGYTDEITPEIAAPCHLIIHPCGTSEDDRYTTVITMNNLHEHGVPLDRMKLIIMTGASQRRIDESLTYFKQAGYEAITAKDGRKKLDHIKKNTTYEEAHERGQAITEVPHLGLRQEARAFIKQLVLILTELEAAA